MLAINTRFIKRKPKVLGIPAYACFVNVLVYMFLMLIMPIFSVLIIAFAVLTHFILYKKLENRPENYLIDKCLFFVEKGVWYKKRDTFRNPNQ